jgi:hypothetical protein
VPQPLTPVGCDKRGGTYRHNILRRKTMKTDEMTQSTKNENVSASAGLFEEVDEMVQEAVPTHRWDYGDEEEDEGLDLDPEDQEKLREWAEKGLVAAHRVFPLHHERFPRDLFVGYCRELVDSPSPVWPYSLERVLEDLACKPHNPAAKRLLAGFPPLVGVTKPEDRNAETPNEGCPIPVLVPIASVKVSGLDGLRFEPSVQALAVRIEGYGLLRPIEIGSDHSLLHGLSRLAACQMLGWERIPAVVRRPEEYLGAKLERLAEKIEDLRSKSLWRRTQKVAEYVGALVEWRYPDRLADPYLDRSSDFCWQAAVELGLPYSYVVQAVGVHKGLCPAAKQLVARGDCRHSLPVLALIALKSAPEAQPEIIGGLKAMRGKRPNLSDARRALRNRDEGHDEAEE